VPVEFLAALSEVSGWLGLYRQKMASPPKRAVNQIEFDEKEQVSSKQARVIAMLQSPGGATIAALMQETGWQPHSVRGFLASIVRKKLKLKLQSHKIDGHRIYHIDGGDPSRASNRQSGQSLT